MQHPSSRGPDLGLIFGIIGAVLGGLVLVFLGWKFSDKLGGLFKKSGTSYSGTRASTMPAPPLSMGGIQAPGGATPYQAPALPGV